MTEPTTPPADQNDAGQAEPQSTYTPPATQADLDRIISERVARTKAQFKDYADLKAKLAEYEPIVQAQKTAEERQAEELTRWQSEAQQWRTTAVGSRVQALAAASFADPSDAVTALSEKFGGYLNAGGEIDDAAIAADLNDVLDRKPHWRKSDAASPASPRVPAPNPFQGSGAGRPTADPRSEFAAFLQGQLRS